MVEIISIIQILYINMKSDTKQVRPDPSEQELIDLSSSLRGLNSPQSVKTDEKTLEKAF